MNQWTSPTHQLPNNESFLCYLDYISVVPNDQLWIIWTALGVLLVVQLLVLAACLCTEKRRFDAEFGLPHPLSCRQCYKRHDSVDEARRPSEPPVNEADSNLTAEQLQAGQRRPSAHSWYCSEHLMQMWTDRARQPPGDNSRSVYQFAYVWPRYLPMFADHFVVSNVQLLPDALQADSTSDTASSSNAVLTMHEFSGESHALPAVGSNVDCSQSHDDEGFSIRKTVSNTAQLVWIRAKRLMLGKRRLAKTQHYNQLSSGLVERNKRICLVNVTCTNLHDAELGRNADNSEHYSIMLNSESYAHALMSGTDGAIAPANRSYSRIYLYNSFRSYLTGRFDPSKLKIVAVLSLVVKSLLLNYILQSTNTSTEQVSSSVLTALVICYELGYFFCYQCCSNDCYSRMRFLMATVANVAIFLGGTHLASHIAQLLGLDSITEVVSIVIYFIGSTLIEASVGSLFDWCVLRLNCFWHRVVFWTILTIVLLFYSALAVFCTLLYFVHLWC